ncbi:MAG: ATP-dependent RecD-like DNA helicase [Lachnospiraceae bacterium]|nr:ATP-dependent RecD-like DNA helicase [Lachnospiraceae bacterium]
MTIQIEGCVNNIVYRNEDNGYTVFELATKDSTDMLTLVGSFSYISEGEYFRLTCQETQHNVYGKQYKVIEAENIEPEDADAMERYLGSGAIKGIGKALAKRIVSEFGDETFRVIEEEPERLADIKGISERMARAISESFYDKRELRTAMMFLQRYGISSNLSVKIYKQYGAGIYEVLKNNPYRLAEEVKGIGFKTADEIALRGGISIDSKYRTRAGILYVLSEAVGLGHTFLPENEFFEMTAKLLDIEPDAIEMPLDSLIMDRKVIPSDMPLNKADSLSNEAGMDDENVLPEKVRCYYLAPYYYMELAVARMLLDLDVKQKANREKTERYIKEIEESLSVELDPIQRDAIFAAAGNGVLILTGGPGTGKTTTINALIRFFENEGMDILLAAPTGRAAKRITETTGREASTIHRMLQMKGGVEEDESARKDDRHGSFEKNETNPLEADVIIIDEMSMVDIALMHALLRAVSQGTRLIMVGDANQLPPVGAGNVLKDIIASGRFTTVRLTKIFRQAAVSDIVVNAHKINKGEEIALDNKSKDFFFLQRDNINDIRGLIIALVRDKLPTYVKASSGDIQVLTPMRKGELGVEKMNTVLQEYLNPPSPSKKEKVYGDITFREGDKVMQIKNNYQIEWESRNSRGFLKNSGSGIFNGDCGIIKSINTYADEMEIVFDDDKTVFYPFSGLDELELAYCITVHKSQGSEYPAVVMPLLSGPWQLFNRNLLYTAVTRAKKCVTIVGSRQAVSSMIKNEKEQNRYSGLKVHLEEMVE